MGLFDKKSIIGAALGVGGAFDKNKKTDKSAVFGAAIGASLGSGQKWTLEDSIRLGATIGALDSMKDDTSINSTSGYSYGGSSGNSSNEYDNLILSTDQEEQLEEAGIDTFDFELMDDDEKREALEDAGLDPFDFDMF